MKQFLLFFLTFIFFTVNARELHVGEGQEYSSLSDAAAVAQPGDAIIIHNGIYTQREDERFRTGRHSLKDNSLISRTNI